MKDALTTYDTIQEHIVFVGAGCVRLSVCCDGIRQLAVLLQLAQLGSVVKPKAWLGVVPQIDKLVVLSWAKLLRIGSPHTLGPVVIVLRHQTQKIEITRSKH